MCGPVVLAVGCLRSFYCISGIFNAVSGIVCIMYVAVNGVMCEPVVFAVGCLGLLCGGISGDVNMVASSVSCMLL